MCDNSHPPTPCQVLELGAIFKPGQFLFDKNTQNTQKNLGQKESAPFPNFEHYDHFEAN